MTPKVIAAVFWQSHRSGTHICELYDKRSGKFVALGMGLTRNIAEHRARSILTHPEQVKTNEPATSFT